MFGKLAFVALLSSFLPSCAAGGFDFGGGCGSGSGQFTLTLNVSGATADVGTIPQGKWNVRVRLTANSDVDVQLFDANNVSKFSEGQAVVAWCADAATCNIGVLGSDEGKGDTMYNGMKIGWY